MSLPVKPGEALRGRYKIRERIGQGGMGNIYLADDLRLEGRLCALKEVEYDRALPEHILQEARDQFLREATVLARLDHHNLPKVSDFFSIDQRDYHRHGLRAGQGPARPHARSAQAKTIPLRRKCSQLGRPDCGRAHLPAQPGTAHRPPRHQTQQP